MKNIAILCLFVLSWLLIPFISPLIFWAGGWSFGGQEKTTLFCLILGFVILLGWSGIWSHKARVFVGAGELESPIPTGYPRCIDCRFVTQPGPFAICVRQRGKINPTTGMLDCRDYGEGTCYCDDDRSKFGRGCGKEGRFFQSKQ